MLNLQPSVHDEENSSELLTNLPHHYFIMKVNPFIPGNTMVQKLLSQSCTASYIIVLHIMLNTAFVAVHFFSYVLTCMSAVALVRPHLLSIEALDVSADEQERLVAQRACSLIF